MCPSLLRSLYLSKRLTQLSSSTLCDLQSKVLESLLCLRLSYLTFGTDFGSLLAPSSHPGLSCCGRLPPPFFTTAKGLKTSSVVIILPTSLLTSGTKPRCVPGCVDVLAGLVLCVFLPHELLPVVCVLTCLWAGFSAGAYPDTPSMTYNIQTNKS